ncbi:MAG: MerR family transcriptional regulator [Elainellaceae cyanobacterium]
MNRLLSLAQSNPQWSLEEFVQVANNLLPQFLPLAESAGRVPEDVNPRLVRYYTTQQLLNKPLKQGREARYTYRHLLQLLVVRRLLTEGLSTSAIGTLVSTKTDRQLEALLQGGVQLTVETANPALAFLQQIQNRVTPPPAPLPPAAAQASDRSASQPESWTRLEILPGLELHVREDFVYPSSLQEQQNLLQMIAQRLASLTNHKQSP